MEGWKVWEVPVREGWRVWDAEAAPPFSVGVDVPGKRAAWAFGWYWCGVAGVGVGLGR